MDLEGKLFELCFECFKLMIDLKPIEVRGEMN
jgi:hypothetical protein